MAPRILAAYAEGEFYPPLLAANVDATRSAGWNTLILGLFHIDAAGQIGFNNTRVFTDGSYAGDELWPSQIASLLDASQGSTVRTLAASFGGGGVSDFANVQAIYRNNNDSFAGTTLQANFEALYKAMPTITIIDMDVEEFVDTAPFIAFCRMLATIGFGITFCPYTNTGFWTASLAALNASHPGAVKWWNLQAYDGGSGNDPSWWAAQIGEAIPGFNTRGFIVPGDWSRNLAKPQPDPSTWFWQGDCPAAMQSLMVTFATEPSVGGGFLWTIDQTLLYAKLQQQKPDPDPCGAVSQADYVAAISNGLG